MKSKQIKQLVTTAVLLALSIVFQNLRLLLGVNPASTYVIGSLVNICLILAAVMVNVWAGLAISVASPLFALLQGHAQAPMLPWIMLGNGVLVVIFALLAVPGYRKGGKAALLAWAVAGVVGVLIKFCVIAAGNALVLSAKQGTAFAAMLVAGGTAQVQQIITGLIAVVLTYLVLPQLKKAIKE